MINKLKTHKTIWFFIASLSLIVAGIGLFNPNIYSQVITPELLPGTVAQDGMTVLAALALLFLSVNTKEEGTPQQLIALSLLAYLFYAYGIYVIERLYNALYLLYIGIFALSFWTILYGLVSIKPRSLRYIEAAKWVKYLSAGCLLFTAALFYILWAGQLLPLMQSGEKIEFFYSIYILDMALVLPAMMISGVLLLKENPLGLVYAPIVYFKAFTLLFSVGLGELLKPLYAQNVNFGEMSFFIGLSLIYLGFALLHFWKTRFQQLL